MADREAIARIIDPRMWKWHDAYLADAARHDAESLGGVLASDARQAARSVTSASLAKADQIIALREQGGEDVLALLHDLAASDERATRLLSAQEWRPTRAHFEGMRNTVRKTRAAIVALCPETGGGEK